MSLSPSHRDRERIPHQPRPPKHWPVECNEAPTYETEPHRQFKCPECKAVRYEPRDEMQGRVLYCYGDSTTTGRAEL